MKITIVGPRELKALAGPRSIPGVLVSTVVNRGDWRTGLSPFCLGPAPLYSGTEARLFENAWQYAKVYERHVGPDGNPIPEYFAWARTGWDDPRPRRYPMGKGAKPAYSWWNGRKLGYVEARRTIYFPLYRDLVARTPAFARLQAILGQGNDLILFDYDGYDHERLGMSLGQVLASPTRKMGHAFVLKAMLLHGPDIDPDTLPA